MVEREGIVFGTLALVAASVVRSWSLGSYDKCSTDAGFDPMHWCVPVSDRIELLSRAKSFLAFCLAVSTRPDCFFTVSN